MAVTMPKYRCIVHYDMEMFVDAKNEIIAKFKASWRALKDKPKGKILVECKEVA